MYQINIFISHSWSYPEHYDSIAQWIFEENWTVGENKVPIKFYDQSIPKDNPIHNAPNSDALKQAIFSKINNSHLLVIPTGMYATHSNWIQKEIDGAKLYRRPILAVHPWAQERKSSVVAAAASQTVGWTKKSVIDGIWNLYSKHYGS